jgi:hypothetical protein
MSRATQREGGDGGCDDEGEEGLGVGVVQESGKWLLGGNPISAMRWLRQQQHQQQPEA